MSNTRILYHGTTMENAITMLGSNFSSIVDETVWNCSDDDMLYMAEKDYDGEENEGLRIAAETAQIAAAYLGSESSDLVVLKLEIPEFMFDEAYVTEDDSCDNMYGCWQIKQNDLEKSCSLGCQAEKEIGVSVIVLHNAYNRELRPFYLPENELLKDLDDQMLATAVHAVHTSDIMDNIYEDVIGVWDSEEELGKHDFLRKYDPDKKRLSA